MLNWALYSFLGLHVAWRLYLIGATIVCGVVWETFGISSAALSVGAFFFLTAFLQAMMD